MIAILKGPRLHTSPGPFLLDTARLRPGPEIKHDAGGRVSLIGEEVGDRLRFWSEGKPSCRPNSHFCLRPTSGMRELIKGCKSGPHCYGDQFDAAAGSLRPQSDAPMSADAWLAGRELAMEAVKQDLRAR